MINVRQLRRFLPATRKGWALVIAGSGLVIGTVIFLNRGATTAALTYVLF